MRFFNISKKDKQKIVLDFLGFVFLFLIFEKTMRKKIASGFLGFVSVLLSIFEKGTSKKLH